MSLPIVYRDEVPNEIGQAIDWYQQQQSGQEGEFLAALKDHLDFIAENPETYAIEYRRVRAAPMRRFPYVVYYRVERDRIEVIAIQHGRRDPRLWRRRV